MTFKDIKEQSFALFKTNFGKCTAASLTVFFIKAALALLILTFQLVSMKLFGMQCINGLASVVFYLLYLLTYVFIFMPINFGKSLMAAKIANGEDVNTDSIFDCFKENYFYCLGLKLRQAIATLGVLFFVIVVFASVYTFGVNPVYIITGGVAVSLIFLAVYALRYSALANTAIMCGMQDVNITMRKAVRTARKNKHIVFSLLCTMAGWILLSLITCGIGFLFLGFYINISVKKYYLINERGF